MNMLSKTSLALKLSNFIFSCLKLFFNHKHSLFDLISVDLGYENKAILCNYLNSELLFFYLLQVQVLNLISVLVGHESEVIPFANQLVEFFKKV